MKKSILIIIFISIHFTGMSQSIFKIGPSVLINPADEFEVFIESALGVGLSFETGIKSKSSLHIGTSYHYGKYKKKDIQLDPKINQFWGLDTEFRYHFEERYHSAYIGVGFDIKSFSSQNYFNTPVTNTTPMYYNDLGGTEVNIGISYGKFYEFSPKHFVNPYIFLGIGVFDGNEYLAHLRVGLNYGFQIIEN